MSLEKTIDSIRALEKKASSHPWTYLPTSHIENELNSVMRKNIIPLLDLIESAEIMRAHLEDLSYEHLNCCREWDQKIADAFGSV